MFKDLINIVVIIAFCVLSTGQISAAGQNLTLTATEQQQILSEFSTLVLTHYVIPAKAEDYANAIKLAIDEGQFETTRSVSEFINQSNTLIQSTHADKHLGLLAAEKFNMVMAMFHPEQNLPETPEKEHANSAHATSPVNNDKKSAHGPSPGTAHQPSVVQAENAAVASLAEIGIGRVSEISRDGLNLIGYVEILRFDGSTRTQKFLDRVFSTFIESDGIIIDLRLCGGGDASLVNFINNYFFAEPTHLLNSTMGADATGKRALVEHWTSPNHLSSKFANKPLKILLSSKTFSAAESLAYGMQVAGRADLVGETSGGGGYMNDFYTLPNQLGASISVGRTFDPRSGKDWQAKGVVPGTKVDSEHALITALNDYTIESGKMDSIVEDIDRLKIYNLLQSYTNAWYGADPKMMKSLLADNFHAVYNNREGMQLQELNKRQLVKQTADGWGTRINKIHYNRIIRNIESIGDAATGTLILRETIHKMTLQQSGGNWRISKDIFKDKVHG